MSKSKDKSASSELNLVSTCRVELVPTNTLLIKEGESAAMIYFLFHGTVEVTKMHVSNKASRQHALPSDGKEKTVGMLTGGSVFGEISVLTNTTCQASIKTSSKCVLLSVERKHFLDTWCSIPDFKAELLLRIYGKHCRFEHVLNYSVTRKEFMKFTEFEHCEENTLFLGETLDFKLKFMSRTEDENTSCVSRIMSQYVGGDTPCQVNLPEALVEKCRQSFSGTNPTACNFSEQSCVAGVFKKRCPPIHFFDECNEEIYRILDMGAFLRYKKSDSFISLLKKIKFYQGMDLSNIDKAETETGLPLLVKRPVTQQLFGENYFAPPSPKSLFN